MPDEFPLLNTEAGSSIQISADGSTIAYLGVNGGESSLFIRGRSDIAPRQVSNTTGTRMFFLSPSGDEVAFVSGASNLVPDDTNDTWDIFVHDRATGETERVSVSSDGSQQVFDLSRSRFGDVRIALSSEGRVVAFRGMNNLVAGE